MRLRWKLAGLGLVAVALAGCATFQAPTRSSPQNGAIFGYFDIPSDSYGYLQALSIMRYPPQIRAYMGVATDVRYITRGEAFFAYDAEPGQYAVTGIYTDGGGLLGSTQYQLTIVDSKLWYEGTDTKVIKENLFTVKPGELYYFGAERVYKGKQPGLFSNGSFSIGPETSVTEKEVLEKLLPSLKGTPWDEPARELIASLK